MNCLVRFAALIEKKARHKTKKYKEKKKTKKTKKKKATLVVE
jgi:hypothetical protein